MSYQESTPNVWETCAGCGELTDMADDDGLCPPCQCGDGKPGDYSSCITRADVAARMR